MDCTLLGVANIVSIVDDRGVGTMRGDSLTDDGTGRQPNDGVVWANGTLRCGYIDSDQIKASTKAAFNLYFEHRYQTAAAPPLSTGT
jgi:hypothetical protein